MALKNWVIQARLKRADKTGGRAEGKDHPRPGH
jgi:hypothetical protein